MEEGSRASGRLRHPVVEVLSHGPSAEDCGDREGLYSFSNSRSETRFDL